MAAKQNDLFGLPYVVSLILVIIPFTSAICTFITRLLEGKIVAAILRLLLGWNIIWILDIICMVLNKRIFRLLNI